MEEELQVYRALFPEAEVTPIYCSEVDAIKLFLQDSVRLVVANRRLSEEELNSFHTRKFFPESVLMAISGIALITHPENTDSLITVGQFRKILTGEMTSWKELNPESRLGDLSVVFDNPNSGTIHYAIDSICRGEKLASTLTALKSNDEVIDYVSKTPNALGVIGANWVGNSADSTRLSFNEAVKVMAVSGSGYATVGNSYKPYQAYLALREYPLVHDVFILINDPRTALPTGLMRFLTGERGQRIILKSGIVPATQPVRLVNVKDEF
jgi:phosphate transport system substrate-binding protein